MKIDPRIKEYVEKAYDTDAGEALDRLIEIYINACGVSLGERTIAAYAAKYWIHKYLDDNPELPEKMDFKGVMRLRSEEYVKNNESIDRYNTAYLEPHEILRISSLMIDDYTDDVARIAISMGVIYYLSYLMDGFFHQEK